MPPGPKLPHAQCNSARGLSLHSFLDTSFFVLLSSLSGHSAFTSSGVGALFFYPKFLISIKEVVHTSK